MTRFLLLLLLLPISSYFVIVGEATNKVRKDDGLINIFTDDEVKKCYGKISKDPQFVSGNGWVHIVTACREGTEENSDENQNVQIEQHQQEGRRRL